MTDTPATPDPLQAWAAELTALLGLPDEVDVATVLDVARDAAHGVARPAAPLTTFVLGLAVGLQGRVFMILSFVVQLVLLYPSSALMVKRLQDRNKPAWYVALILAPLLLQGLTNIIGITGDPFNQGMLDYLFAIWLFVVGVWFFIELGCLRGTVGPNQYGPDPIAAPAAG